MTKIAKYLINTACVLLLLAPKFDFPYQIIKYIALIYIMWQLMLLMNKLPSKHQNNNQDDIGN